MVAPTQQTIPSKRFRNEPTDLEAAYFRWIQPGAASVITERAGRIFLQHLELAQVRARGSVRTRVYRVDRGADSVEDAASDGKPAEAQGVSIQIVNDDMPLLVDSVTAALRRLGATVTEVVHPVFDVVRDVRGRLQSLSPHDGELTVENTGRTRTLAESWMHVQLAPGLADDVVDRIERALGPLLDDLRRVAEDNPTMLEAMHTVAQQLDTAADSTDDAEFPESAQFLRWLTEGHFAPLGYGYYRFRSSGAAEHGVEPQRVPGRLLGILRNGAVADVNPPASGAKHSALRLATGSVRSLVPGSRDLYFVSVPDYDTDAPTTDDEPAVRGEHVFVGTFTVTGLHEDILDIPIISRRVLQVIEWAGFGLNSFSGQAMLEMLQSFPRAELFSTDARRLFETASAVMNLGLRRQIRLFLRRDGSSGTIYCLVYMPRDRYSTEVRVRMGEVLRTEFDAEQVAYSARATESELAVVYFTVHPGATGTAEPVTESDRERIQDLLFATTRSWSDRLVSESASHPGIVQSVVQDYANAFPASYQADHEPARALADLRRLERLAEGAIDTNLYRDPAAASGEWRFTLYVAGDGVSLSRVLPVVHSLGVEVVDEQPYRITLRDGSFRWIYDFGLRVPSALLRGALDTGIEADLAATTDLAAVAETSLRRRFPEAVAAMWFGHAEVDGLNELVLRAGLHWRQIAVLRAYAKYLQQAGFAYTIGNITRVLLAHPVTARSCTELFGAYFDPEGVGEQAQRRASTIAQRVQDEIDAVLSLDTDRILRALLGLITATLRTNYYRVEATRQPREYLSFKLNPQAIAELPQPRPKFEIFVYSPRVEGVHLRFGAVARGGLRWSDRLE
ncbi:NAD-glutamate dehydrogenase domain-containing protein, partial [Nocardia callitridis]|uniref:NAD-glutamate dehydrogenase domain-containing protein n=1 Tax=Nocardia callitridis TaxID=648753 RepID=UPI0031F030DA